MELRDFPVQVIAHVDGDGTVTPLKFRYEDERSQTHTAQVLKVLKSREVPFVGVEAQVFQCLVREDEQEQVYELKYAFRIHRWTLLRRIA